jgi:hypothetical protein
MEWVVHVDPADLHHTGTISTSAAYSIVSDHQGLKWGKVG